jgi:hypothetical protein
LNGQDTEGLVLDGNVIKGGRLGKLVESITSLTSYGIIYLDLPQIRT